MSNESIILERIEEIKLSLLNQKRVFSFVECKRYTGFSSSHLYKLTSQGKIPHFKPEGKFIYFDREELEKWLLRNPIKQVEEIEQEAINYTTKKRGAVK